MRASRWPGCTADQILGLSGTYPRQSLQDHELDPATARPADLGPAPLRDHQHLTGQVADPTYVSTWAGFAYVAFTDAWPARRILGWRVASTMATSILDAIGASHLTRQQEGAFDLKDVIHHTDSISVHIDPVQRAARRGRSKPSVGAVGSSRQCTSRRRSPTAYTRPS